MMRAVLQSLSLFSRPLAALAAGVTPALVLATAAAACDKSGPLAELDASSTWRVTPNAAAPLGTSSPSPATAQAAPEPRVMPERPVPTSSPTVLITMPEDTQLKAIQYMAAMQAPQPSDAYADPEFAKEIAEHLRTVGKIDVVSSGRRIDILLERGCDATLPRDANDVLCTHK